MTAETTAQLVATVLIAALGSQWFGEFVKNVFGTSNKAIMSRVDKLADKVEENEATNARSKILSFNSDLLKNDEITHTREEFIDVLYMIDKYERYCRDHPNYQNNRAVLAIKNIKKTYMDCSDNGTFL